MKQFQILILLFLLLNFNSYAQVSKIIGGYSRIDKDAGLSNGYSQETIVYYKNTDKVRDSIFVFIFNNNYDSLWCPISSKNQICNGITKASYKCDLKMVNNTYLNVYAKILDGQFSGNNWDPINNPYFLTTTLSNEASFGQESNHSLTILGNPYWEVEKGTIAFRNLGINEVDNDSIYFVFNNGSPLLPIAPKGLNLNYSSGTFVIDTRNSDTGEYCIMVRVYEFGENSFPNKNKFKSGTTLFLTLHIVAKAIPKFICTNQNGNDYIDIPFYYIKGPGETVEVSYDFYPGVNGNTYIASILNTLPHSSVSSVSVTPKSGNVYTIKASILIDSLDLFKLPQSMELILSTGKGNECVEYTTSFYLTKSNPTGINEPAIHANAAWASIQGDKIQIFDPSNQVSKFEVWGVLGQLITSGFYTDGAQIPISTLGSGIFFLKLIRKNGELVSIQKFTYMN